MANQAVTEFFNKFMVFGFERGPKRHRYHSPDSFESLLKIFTI